jgi:molecular chaperone DnaK (HSP70)
MHVGIDLGTAFSRIARMDARGTPVLVPDFRAADQMETPSVVHVGPEGALVGRPAEELLEDAPDLPAVRHVKLRLGSAESALTDALGRRWLPEGVAALLLRKLRRDAQAHADEPIRGRPWPSPLPIPYPTPAEALAWRK